MDSESFIASDTEDQEITDEQLDQIADIAINSLKEIFRYFDLENIVINEYDGDEGELILDITGNNLAVLIGHHGKTLDSLQYLISSIIYKEIGFRFPVIIDVKGYKNNKKNNLERLACNFANKAFKQQRSISLHPMSPYERRIIHVTLKDDDRVTTISEGIDKSRHVVIIPNSSI